MMADEEITWDYIVSLGEDVECMACEQKLTQDNTVEGVAVVHCGGCGNKHAIHVACLTMLRTIEANGMDATTAPKELFQGFLEASTQQYEAQRRAFVAAQN